jgi:hypothetical protein
MTGIDGKNDSIMKYSTCVAGNYWYFPTFDEINNQIHSFIQSKL